MKSSILIALLSISPASLATELLPPTLQQETDAPAEAEDSGLALVGEENDEATRPGAMELSFRGRYLNMPDSLLNIWFFSDKDTGLDIKRPKVKGYAIGLEFAIKSRAKDDEVGSSNGLFYFDWISNLTEAGYWDDVEDPPNHTDGDWVIPSKSLGFLVLGANYAYEIHMVRTAKTNGNFGLSLLVGAGLGVGVLLGEMEYWDGEKGSVPSYERYTVDPSDGDKLDRISVLPVVDVNIGLRFNIADRFVMRVEGGLHDLFYFGGSAGIMF